MGCAATSSGSTHALWTKPAIDLSLVNTALMGSTLSTQGTSRSHPAGEDIANYETTAGASEDITRIMKEIDKVIG